MEKTEYSLLQWISKAQTYCSSAERCEDDVRSKLIQWGVTNEHVETIINLLKSEGYVDNYRYALAVVHDKVTFQGWGRMKIAAFLQCKHISSEMVTEALNHIDAAEYTCRLRHILQQRKSKTKEQTLRFLLQRGYSYSEIRSLWTGDDIKD